MKILSVNAETLEEAAAVLRSGGVVLFPTESYYGAAVNALDAVAVARLLALKRRPDHLPLPLILPDRASLDQVVSVVPPASLPFMDRHWPGALTLVLPARPKVPAPLVGPHGVGVRVSPHPVASALAQAFGFAITATSANTSGEPPPTRAETAALALPGADRVLDGGDTPGGAPSTVLAVAPGGRLTLLRRGAVDVQLP